MKYLKLIDSFDEFAEDAKAGTVYYDIGDSVYYWLNLRSIWGYIGYDKSNNAFYTNGRIWSIVPAVPDPETLESPVRIDKNSFVDVPDTITFKYSPFNIVPIKTFYGVPNKTVRYVVECNNDYSPTEIVGKTNNVEIEIKGASWENLRTLSGITPYLIFTDTNGLIDLSTINSSGSQDWAYLVTEKESTSISEDVFFKNISQGVQRQKDWRKLFKVNIPEGVTEHIAKLHQTYSGNRLIYSVKSIPSTLTSLVIDGTDSQGIMDDESWSDVNPGGNSKFNDITYINISDYGGYYKRYLKSESIQTIPQELLNFCKTNNCELYSDNYTIHTTTQSWKTFTNAEYNLTGVKYFRYYSENSNIIIDDVPQCYIVGSVGLTENDIEENRVCGGDKQIIVFATPELTNIDLNYFAFLETGYTKDNCIYIRTNTSDIYLKDLPNYTRLHINNKHIHISGNTYNLCAYVLGTDFTGNIIFENRQQSGTPKRTSLYINDFSSPNLDWALGNRINNPVFVLSGATTSQNPTPEDYYYTGLTTGNMRNLFNRKVFDIDLVNGVTIGFSSTTSKLYTPADWSSIKCFKPATAYIDTMYVGDSSSSVEAGSAQINTLIAAVPNITASSSNAAFYFSSTQYALLSSTQIDYLTGLGYLVIERI